MLQPEEELSQNLAEIIILNDIISFLDLLLNIKELLNTKEGISPYTFESPDTEEGKLLHNLRSLFIPNKDFLPTLSDDLRKQESDMPAAANQSCRSGDDKKKQGSVSPGAVTQSCETVDHLQALRDCYYKHLVEKFLLKKPGKQSAATFGTSSDFSERRLEEFAVENLLLINPLAVSSIYFKRETIMLEDLFSRNEFFKTIIWEKAVINSVAIKSHTNVALKMLVGKLFDILEIAEENSPAFIDTLLSLLSQLHKSKKSSLEEPLYKIIEETEKILIASPIYCKYIGKPPFHIDSDFTNVLGIGLCIANRSCDAHVNTLLNLILKIGNGHSDFSVVRKLIIGYLMTLALDPIKLFIEEVFRSYRMRSFCSIIKKKTALRMILNDYSKFTSGRNPQTPIYQKIEDSLNLLDKVNKKFCNDSSDSE